MSEGNIARIDQVAVSTLPVPHLTARIYRGLDKIVVTVPSVHPAPARCGFRPGPAADGHGMPASFSARAIRATE